MPGQFWASPGLEPKRIYRWIMRFNINDSERNIDEWLVKRASRPSWTLTESQHSFLNHTFYYPGRIQYDELSVTLVDSITPNGAVNLTNLLHDAGYVTPDLANVAGTQGYKTISKAGWGRDGAGLGNVEISQLDEDGREMETWKFFNTWIKSCNLNELNYESDELLNIDLVMRYDYFKVGAGSSDRFSITDIAEIFQNG